MDGTQTGTTTSGQRGTGSNGNESFGLVLFGFLAYQPLFAFNTKSSLYMYIWFVNTFWHTEVIDQKVIFLTIQFNKVNKIK